MSDFLKEAAQKTEADFLSHVSLEVQMRLVDPAPIEWAEWQLMRMNSYERQLLIPRLDDRAFLNMLESHLESGGIEESSKYARPASTYQDQIQHSLIHQLRCRFELLLNRVEDE